MLRTVMGVILTTLLIVGLVGCRGDGRTLKVEYVTGIVTENGAPIVGATVSFVPVTDGVGEAAGGMSGADGSYTLTSMNGSSGKGAVAADYIVSVSKIEVLNFERGDPNAPPDPFTGEPAMTFQKHLLPDEYRKPGTSPLRATVKSGRNKIDLAL